MNEKDFFPLTVIIKTNKLRNIVSCYLDVWLRRNECLRISMIVFFFPSTFIHRGILQELFVNLSIRRRTNMVCFALYTMIRRRRRRKITSMEFRLRSKNFRLVCGSNDPLRKYFASDGTKKENTAKCVCS